MPQIWPGEFRLAGCPSLASRALPLCLSHPLHRELSGGYRSRFPAEGEEREDMVRCAKDSVPAVGAPAMQLLHRDHHTRPVLHSNSRLHSICASTNYVYRNLKNVKGVAVHLKYKLVSRLVASGKKMKHQLWKY